MPTARADFALHPLRATTMSTAAVRRPAATTVHPTRGRAVGVGRASASQAAPMTSGARASGAQLRTPGWCPPGAAPGRSPTPGAPGAVGSPSTWPAAGRESSGDGNGRRHRRQGERCQSLAGQRPFLTEHNRRGERRAEDDRRDDRRAHCGGCEDERCDAEHGAEHREEVRASTIARGRRSVRSRSPRRPRSTRTGSCARKRAQPLAESSTATSPGRPDPSAASIGSPSCPYAPCSLGASERGRGGEWRGDVHGEMPRMPSSGASRPSRPSPQSRVTRAVPSGGLPPGARLR